MPMPANSYRVVLAGSMPGGEIWSTGFCVEGAAPTDDATANELAALWQSELFSETDPAAMREMLQAYCSAGVVWRTTTIYSYPTGGSKATVIGTYAANEAGQATSFYLPNQVAMVVTLKTGGAGRRRRGRMYLPLNAVPLGADGQASSNTTNDVATVWANTFTDWNASGDNGTVSVCSQSATAAYAVTSVEVDTRMDVQRRRAASQAINSRTAKPVT